MRIALYENLPSGGGKRAAFEFARALTAHGHMVDLWTTTAADTMFIQMEQVTQRQFRYQWPEPRPFPRALPGINGYLATAFEFERLRRVSDLGKHMAKEIDAGKYDFVFAHQCYPHLLHAPYILRFLRTPSVYYCQEPMRAFYDPPLHRSQAACLTTLSSRLRTGWYAPIHNKVRDLRKAEDYANAQSATLILANSYFSAESIYRAYHRRALVSYLGIDTHVFHPLELPREDFVLSVGEIQPHKGYDFLIEALAYVPSDKRPPLVLVGNVAGEQELGYLQALAICRGVTLEVKRNLPLAELVRLYNQARAVVYAPVLEPFGFVPLEAMACGTPVVAVAEGGVRETVRDGETGLLAQRDPQIFARTLQRLLDDKDLQTQLGVTGVSMVRSPWTWSAAYDRLMDLVQTNLHQPKFKPSSQSLTPTANTTAS